MSTIKVEGKNLQVFSSQNQSNSLSLDALRLVYLFLPHEFKWRVILPSETQYRYLDLDSLSKEDFSALSALLQQQAIQEDKILFVLKDYENQSLSIPLGDFSKGNVDILTELLHYRTERIENEKLGYSNHRR